MKLHIKSILYATLMSMIGQFAQADQELNVYSARKEAYIKPLLDQFGEIYRVKVNLVTGKADALIERLNAEGKNSPADVLITVDAGRLHRAKSIGLFQAIHNQNIIKQAPEQYRDPEGYWFGLSLRARVIVASKERVNLNQLSTYEALIDRKWKKRICIRSSSNIYNQSLVASMIAHHGAEATRDWAQKLVANFARKPQGGDRDQIKAVAAGQCDIAVVNSYYLGKMLIGRPEQQAAASRVTLFWPNQSGRGVHVNISGIGVSKYAGNTDLAIKLIEFFYTDEAQAWYGDANLEYPVRGNGGDNRILKSWGTFKADTLNLSRLGELNASALLVMDKAGWR